MKQVSAKHLAALCAISGLLSGGVFSFGWPALLLPVFLLPLFASFAESTKKRTLKQSLGIGASFFGSFYLVVLSWFLDTNINLLAGLNAQSSRPLLLFCLVTMSAVLTLTSLPFCALLHYMQRRIGKPNFTVFALLASGWVVMEWLRSIGFSVFLTAPEASVGDYWNFGSLGLGIISTPAGSLSRFIGMYGLTALVLAVSLCIYWALKKHYRPLLLVIFVALLGSYAAARLPESGSQKIHASLLQRQGLLNDLSQSVPIRNQSSQPKDLIVLPEYSAIYTPGYESFADKYVTSRLHKSGVALDVTADFIYSMPRNSFLQVRDKQKNVVVQQSKRLLIPTGEYLPGIITWFYNLTGQQAITDNFAQTRKLQKGASPRVINSQRVRIAPVACSGILGRNIYRQLVREGGEVLTNSASLATFSNSQSYFRQSVQMAQFHAVANNRTYVQATMGAPAFVLNPNGTYNVVPDGTRTEIIDFDFAPAKQQTPYTKYGEWPLTLAALYIAGYAAFCLFWKRRSRLIN